MCNHGYSDSNTRYQYQHASYTTLIHFFYSGGGGGDGRGRFSLFSLTAANLLARGCSSWRRRLLEALRDEAEAAADDEDGVSAPEDDDDDADAEEPGTAGGRPCAAVAAYDNDDNDDNDDEDGMWLEYEAPSCWCIDGGRGRLGIRSPDDCTMVKSESQPLDLRRELMSEGLWDDPALQRRDSSDCAKEGKKVSIGIDKCGYRINLPRLRYSTCVSSTADGNWKSHGHLSTCPFHWHP